MAITSSAPETSIAPPARGNLFYLPSLDVLRLFAFLAVFLLHTTPGLIGDPANQTTLEYVYGRAHASLGYGVSVFFVLSAYLITTLLLREQSTAGKVSLRRFYFRRILRICPVFFTALILGSIVVPQLHGDKPDWLWFGLYASFFGNHFVAWPTPFPNIAAAPLWSVCVEEQFYIFWPWTVKFAHARWLSRICLFLLIGTPVVRMFLASQGEIRDSDLWFKTVTHLDCFAAGAIVALSKDGPVGPWLARNARWVLPLSIIALPLQSIYAPFAGFVTVPIGPIQAMSYSIVAWASAIIVWTVSGLNAPKQPMLRNTLVTGGKLSYSLYAFHGCALELARALFTGFTIWAFAFEALLTTGLACASYYGFERRFLKLKNRLQTVKSGPIS